MTYIRNRKIIHCKKKKKDLLLFYSQLTCELINVSENIFYPHVCQQADENKFLGEFFSLYICCTWLHSWSINSGSSGVLFHNLNLNPLCLKKHQLWCNDQSLFSVMGCNFQSLCAVKFWQFYQFKPFLCAFSQHFMTHLQWQMLWFNY